MATYVINRKHTDYVSTGEPVSKSVYAFSGADSSEADAACARLNRAARALYQFTQLRPVHRTFSDHDAYYAAAKATLGAVDPAAVADADNPFFDATYTVTEVPAFAEPTEDPPANEQERVLRDIRDQDV